MIYYKLNIFLIYNLLKKYTLSINRFIAVLTTIDLGWKHHKIFDFMRYSTS